MYWICFGDSAKGMLHMAMPDIGKTPERIRLVSLDDNLSIGDISDLRDRKARAFGICPWKDDPEFAGEGENCIRRYYEEALPAFEQADEAVIWYGDNPAEQCGMLRAAHDLYARGVPFSLVHVDRLAGDALPPPRPPGRSDGVSTVFITTKNRVLNFTLQHTPQAILQQVYYCSCKRRYRQRRAEWVIYRGVGELDPEAAPLFYRKCRRVPECEAKLLYSRWEQLVRENAPLRVIENGRPVSAPADYYDAAILENTPTEETVAAFVVGRTLGTHAVNDCLIFERIRVLAASGELELVKDGGNYRDTVVRRAKQG